MSPFTLKASIKKDILNDPKTLGQHLKRRRLELNMRQKDVALRLSINIWTYLLWENDRCTPMIRMWPRVIEFLGYDPHGEPQTLRKQIVAYRRRQGLSRKHMAIILGVDEGTMSRWETYKEIMMPTMAEARIPEPKDVYKEAGVDTDQADAGLQRLIRRVRSTWPMAGALGEVKLDIGYFANVISLGHVGLAICTDGIGSKAIIAQMVGKYDTVGIDCIAMNVNDLICVGARPLSMVDYIAVQMANADLLDALSVGLTKGAKIAGISISGGEISQIKDIIGGYRDG